MGDQESSDFTFDKPKLRGSNHLSNSLNYNLDPGCPSFFGVMSHKFVGNTPKKVGHLGSR